MKRTRKYCLFIIVCCVLTLMSGCASLHEKSYKSTTKLINEIKVEYQYKGIVNYDISYMQEDAEYNSQTQKLIAYETIITNDSTLLLQNLNRQRAAYDDFTMIGYDMFVDGNLELKPECNYINESLFAVPKSLNEKEAKKIIESKKDTIIFNAENEQYSIQGEWKS